jgi:hypothetical protein
LWRDARQQRKQYFFGGLAFFSCRNVLRAFIKHAPKAFTRRT